MVHQLISSVYILSGLQFKPIAFRKALLTYGYERRLDALITYV